jgi:Pectate lyase superfamily protein/F5/8 type C domain
MNSVNTKSHGAWEHFRRALFASALLLLAQLSWAASVDSLVSVTQVVSSSQQAGYLGPQNLISSQGLVADPTQPDTFLLQSNALNFNSGYGTPNDETPLVHFDFGAIQKVKAFHVWNGNEPGYTWRGFRGVTVQYSNDAARWTSIPARFEFKQAPGKDGYAGQRVLLPSTIVARYVRLVCNSTWRNFGDPDIASLARVQFYSGEVPLPISEEAGRWPLAAGVVNVRAFPYFAAGDGESDDTAAIQQAILDHEGRGRTIYLPEGIYLVSSPLKFSANTANNRNGLFGQNTLRGDDEGSTTIRLRDATLTNANSPQAVLSTGYISFLRDGIEQTTADWFNNNVSDLTINIGSGNAGAKGLEFYSNNTGSVRNVRIVSGDGRGAIGRDLGHLDKNGPLLVKDLVVSGFSVGVRTALTVNSQTFENIRLVGQAQTAFDNNGQSVSIKGLTTRGQVTAFHNRFGTAALVDATLVGTGAASSAAAVINGETLFARDIRSSGFARTIENTYGAGANVVGTLSGDYVSTGSVLQLFGGSPNSLRLSAPSTPMLEDAPVASWVNIRDFRLTTEDNDSPAFQRAIDSGARDIYLLSDARIVLKSDVLIRGNLAQVHGMQARVLVNAGVTVRAVNELNSPVVVFDQFSVQTSADSPSLVNASGRRMVVLDSVVSVRGTGTGAIFLENVAGRFEFGKHNTWARQLNSEPDGVKVTNNGGRLWILGLKTERAGTLVATKAGGTTEVLGGLAYTTTPGIEPMFEIEDGRLSATIGEIAYNVQPYSVLVRETRQGVTRSLLRGQAPLRFQFLGGSALPLFVGSP